jgi:hypothetical protein
MVRSRSTIDVGLLTSDRLSCTRKERRFDSVGIAKERPAGTEAGNTAGLGFAEKPAKRDAKSAGDDV